MGAEQSAAGEDVAVVDSNDGGNDGEVVDRLNVRSYLVGSELSAFSLSDYPIGSNDSVYMKRWILHTPWGDLRLHHILRSDHDRDLHDHPFDFVSFLLTGGYTEWLEAKDGEDCGSDRLVPHHRKWLSIRYVQADTAHRLVLDRPVWTVVWSWPKRRRWGFYVGGLDGGSWVDAREYVGGVDTP